MVRVAQPKTDIIGGGIIPCGKANELSGEGCPVTASENIASLGVHQTGRYSAVIHASPHFRPDSMRFHLYIAGNALMRYSAEDKLITHAITGKLPITTTHGEDARNYDLADRAE